MADEIRLTIRLTPADDARLKRLLITTGITNRSDLVRYALAELARSRELELPPQLRGVAS